MSRLLELVDVSWSTESNGVNRFVLEFDRELIDDGVGVIRHKLWAVRRAGARLGPNGRQIDLLFVILFVRSKNVSDSRKRSHVLEPSILRFVSLFGAL
jgi:hypothetical protein